MIRIILKGSVQISPDDFAVFHETVEIDSEELEQKMSNNRTVVGAEVIKDKDQMRTSFHE